MDCYLGRLLESAQLVSRRRISCFRFALLLAAGCTAIATQATSWAAESVEATTSNAARQEAMRAIPLKKIEAKYRHNVQQVLNDVSLYRRLPTLMVDCNPRLFTFLAQNPEALVAMWRRLGITEVDLERTSADTFRLSDGSGTTGRLEIVEQNCDDNAQNRIVMYAEGTYEGKPFKRPLRAQCVLLLRSGSMQETNGRKYVAARLDTFVRFDQVGLELVAKAVHPWVGKTADRNFADTLQFISNLSHEAETRPEAVGRLVTGLPRVSSSRQSQLVQIAYQCGASDTESRVVKR